jgi:hypothetical protein
VWWRPRKDAAYLVLTESDADELDRVVAER